jgi:hypothetical protein
MKKLEETSAWPIVVLRADEGKSLREIAEEVDCTPGCVKQALERNGIVKAPAPPGPRARRGASPPPPREPKAPKVKGEKQPRQKAPKAAKPKTFPEVLAGVIEGEFGIVGPGPARDWSIPEAAEYNLRSVLRSLGLMPKSDNLSDDNTDDDRIVGSEFASAVKDPDEGGEDDGGDCDGDSTDDEFVSALVADSDGLNVVGLPVVTFDADSQPSVVGEVIGQEINEDGGLSVQIAVDPNEQTLRGEIIDDWGTPPSFTIPSDEELASMNRDDLRKLAANPGLKGWAYLKGYSKMSPDDLRANLAKVRNDSV